MGTHVLISLQFEDVKKKQKMSADAASKPKAKKVSKDHPTYKAMIGSAIIALKSRGGSSRQAIQKYIEANYKDISNCGQHLKVALKSGVDKGDFVRTKGAGASGSFKLGKIEKPAPKKKKPAE